LGVTSEEAQQFARAQDVLESAEILFHSGKYLDANSRSYYSMFYVVRALMWSTGKRYKSHAAQISAFHEQWIRTGKIDRDYYRFLNAAFARRNNSDYTVGFEDTAESTEEQIIRARAFLEIGKEKLGG
jgi:uncharacterized protein (UPF0332 family)